MVIRANPEVRAINTHHLFDDRLPLEAKGLMSMILASDEEEIDLETYIDKYDAKGALAIASLAINGYIDLAKSVIHEYPEKE